MAWLKTIHMASLLVWCAGLFYLPALFAVHPRTPERWTYRRLRMITRFSYIVVTSPAAVIAIGTGIALIFISPAIAGWLVLKLTAISVLTMYHLYCGWMIARLHRTRVVKRPGWHVVGMLVPATMIPSIFWLVLHKPL
ncbi:MAG TPA: CopD family protein [Burkholderiaceae bacterium]|jgi:protoporphyrinogen IX oxidase|nr:CopD family protein [Burkholderiaceae bacterium]